MVKPNRTSMKAGLGIGLGTAFLAGAGLLVAAAMRQSKRRRSIAGKVVLIAGGSRGLGLAMAEEFGRNGARLILTARNPYELENARKRLLSLGLGLQEDDILLLPCDLTQAEQTRAMVEQAIRHFGRIDVLVNNAGIVTVGPVENQPLSAFYSAMEANFYATLHATLAVLPDMLERRTGNIVNITSIGAKMAVPHLLPYSASKFAALGFSQGLHAELRSKGIVVTTVCPGLMRTGSHIHALFTGDRDREYRWFSLGASLPGLSTSARSAARKIVAATGAGCTEIAITTQALVAARLAQVLPSCTATLMHWVTKVVLPRPVSGADHSLMPGKDVRGKELTPLITLGRQAARNYNESA